MDSKLINRLAIRARENGDHGKLSLTLRPYIENFFARSISGVNQYHIDRNVDSVLDSVPGSLKSWDPKSIAFLSYITNLAIKRLSNPLRSSKREKQVLGSRQEIMEAFHPAKLTVYGEMENAKLRSSLARAIGKLKARYPHYHSVFMMSNLGLTPKEIAQSLDITHGTVKSRLNRAHVFLRQQLAKDGIRGNAEPSRQIRNIGDRKKAGPRFEEEEK